jgi:hypothetical protein
MALRYSQKRAALHKKMAFDKSIIPVTDIMVWFIWQRMNISANTTLEVLSNLVQLCKNGDLLFDQTAIDKYLAIEK